MRSKRTLEMLDVQENSCFGTFKIFAMILTFDVYMTIRYGNGSLIGIIETGPFCLFFVLLFS